MLLAGKTPAEAAKAVGVARQTVYRCPRVRVLGTPALDHLQVMVPVLGTRESFRQA